jgi:hypothetical protein
VRALLLLLVLLVNWLGESSQSHVAVGHTNEPTHIASDAGDAVQNARLRHGEPIRPLKPNKAHSLSFAAAHPSPGGSSDGHAARRSTARPEEAANAAHVLLVLGQPRETRAPPARSVDLIAMS